MRIACLHVPGLVVQVHARAAPHLFGAAFAVLAPQAGQAPARIIACSRPAHEAGVRPGMTATQARAVAATVRLVDADLAAYQRALTALGEALYGLSVTVEVPAHPGEPLLALVPPGSRGQRFGERVLEVAAALGFHGRVGIADDRFSAWAATQVTPRQPVRAVPAGGSAAFLAPLPLALLPMDADVRRTLGLLGIRTLGDFAALPAPSVGRRWAQGGLDPQILARGEDLRPLAPFTPVAAVLETLDLDGAVHELEPILFGLRPLCERVCVRLRGRGRAAARVAVTLAGRGEHGRAQTLVPVAPARPTASATTLVDLLRAHLSERRLEHDVEQVSVEVLEEGDLEVVELDLFDRAGPGPGAVDVAVARLRAAFGEHAASGAVLVDRHRPEAAWALTPFDPEAEHAWASKPRRRGLRTGRGRAATEPSAPSGRGRSAKADELTPTVLPALVRAPGALRLLDPPEPIEVPRAAAVRSVSTAAPNLERLTLVASASAPRARVGPGPGANASAPSAAPPGAAVRPGAAAATLTPGPSPGTEPDTAPPSFRLGGVLHRVTAASGPTRLEAEWWTDEPLARDYFEVATADGGRYWLYRDHVDGSFYLHGIFD
jgi:nucleotidyltransferase/DNA polymerase involved in DNA repair